MPQLHAALSVMSAEQLLSCRLQVQHFGLVQRYSCNGLWCAAISKCCYRSINNLLPIGGAGLMASPSDSPGAWLASEAAAGA